MRAVTVVVALVLCAVTAAAQDGKKYVSKAGKYTVTFPGAPRVHTVKAKGLELYHADFSDKRGTLLVTYFTIPAAAGKQMPKQLFDTAQQLFVIPNQKPMISTKDIEFGKDKLPARNVEEDYGFQTSRALFVLRGNRMYRIGYSPGPVQPGGDEVDEFFKSFELTK